MQKLEESELRKAADLRLRLTVIYFPIFRQARPDFFRVCLQLRNLGEFGYLNSSCITEKYDFDVFEFLER